MPIDHSLCGELSVEGFFDGLPVDGDPLMYDAATSTFSAETTDGGLIGDEPIILPYSLEAHFVNYPPADYPTVATASATADIAVTFNVAGQIYTFDRPVRLAT